MASCPNDAVTPSEINNTKKKNIRHVEKRRIATCAFADRVARVSIDHYVKVVPESERPPQTCLATIVVHNSATDTLKVMGMGVGTKFLSEEILHKEEKCSIEYGKRLRDCHAEVLARRAFRRQVLLEILRLMTPSDSGIGEIECVLQPSILCSNDGICKYHLRSGVTLHFYSSSAPCGNATLKKFAKMTKERFREDLRPDEWPKEPHEPIHGSSIQLGQFALLLKKDNHATTHDDNPASSQTLFKNNQTTIPKGKVWPAMMSDDWTPPGTTTVVMTNKGSIHTCSDKICRWNYLGLQGSLLSTLLEEPLYLSTVTVGRKFTSCICRRAICCRMEESSRTKNPQNDGSLSFSDDGRWQVRLHHPAILGTAVYMDESGIVETSADVQGQDVRFHSSKSWCWWPWLEHEKVAGYVECIDGSSGYLWSNHGFMERSSASSLVSTYSLLQLFLQAHHLAKGHDGMFEGLQNEIFTLADLRSLKRHLSPQYEASKDEILSRHRIFRQWRRREFSIEIVEQQKSKLLAFIEQAPYF